MKYPHIFSPMKIGNCEIPNRMVVPAMVTNLNTETGEATERYIRYHEEKAKGGWGLIITEDYAVSRHAGGYPFVAALYDESQIESHKKLTDRIHKYDTKIFCQIYHAGRQSNSRVNGGVQPVSCSPIPCPWNKQIPHQLTAEEIHRIVKDFGITAANAKRAGFDGVEVHIAHGYLIHQFISPSSNKRIDEYGGNYENRTRIVREVLSEVRNSIGEDFPMMVRVSAEEYAEGGLSAYESRQLIRDVEAWGADAIHVSYGMYGTPSSVGTVSSFFQHNGWNVKLAAMAKELVKIPVVAVGRIQEPWMAEDILASGQADFIGMARQSLADPYWPEKARAGEDGEIRYCVGCLQACLPSGNAGGAMQCLANPELGNEYATDWTKTDTPKKVFVAGGGVAGMEAARVATLKGHKVTLFEKSDELGGQFVSASYPPYKGGFGTLPAWQYRQLKKLGVEVRLNTPLTREIVMEEKPDKVILATGAKPVIPPIPGIDLPNVVLAEDVLRGRSDTGMNVLVAGANLIGSETAAFLCVQCKAKVTLIEMGPAIAMDMKPGIRDDIRALLNRNFVEVKTGVKLAGITAQGALLDNGAGAVLYPCDTIVLALGVAPNNPLEEELKDLCDVVVVGNALKTGKAHIAMREGFLAGLNA